MKEFNVTGLCIPEKHYMADISEKLKQIMRLINRGSYFTINRPRQYGKTTTLYMISRLCNQGKEYLAIRISFESIDEPSYKNHGIFIKTFLKLLQDKLTFLKKDILVQLIEANINSISNMKELSSFITKLVNAEELKIVLLIDEVDKSSNNQLFLDFLGMLRDKYMLMNAGEDNTFHSVVLTGVHDIKSLKLKIRPEDKRKYNSPWNIATDFEVNLSLTEEEIESMLLQYCKESSIEMCVKKIAEKLFFYTSGYPFLVSKLCKIIDEKIMLSTAKWNEKNIDEAVKIILKERNTNFDSLIKNLENDTELYEIVYSIIINGDNIALNIDNPTINKGILYGIFKNQVDILKIHNKVYEQRIYNYMSSKIETTNSMGSYNFRDNFVEQDGSLNFETVLIKFQQFMKKEYSEKDDVFLERNGRLLFLAFIKPIINGKGFDFKEVQISEEKRLDIVITYLNAQYLVELKLWHGNEAHKKGINQLKDYMDRVNLDKGYLVIYDFRKNEHKKWNQERIFVDHKDIFVIWI